MEQLANMPVWAQIFSIGTFMFASGVLMTRIPLAPAIILSFFYLYGALSTTPNAQSFTLQHPWIIAGLHIVIPFVFLFLIVISGYSPITIGIFGLGILILLGCCIWEGLLLFKWISNLSPITIHRIIFNCCLWAGIIVGIWGWLDLCTMGYMPNYPLWKVFQFVILSLLCIAVCVCVCISFGKPTMWMATCVCCVITIIVALICIPKPIDTYLSKVLSLWINRQIF